MVITVVGGGIAALLALFAPMASTRAAAQIKQGPGVLAPGERGSLLCSDDGGGCREDQMAALAKRTPRGPVPRTKWDGKPDFNGVFYPQVTIAPAPVPLESLYRPHTLAARKKLDPEDTLLMHCVAHAPIEGAMSPPHPVQLLQAPGVFVMVDEYLHNYRIIPTDGRPHDPTLKPSFMGDSVGHWEGDTLVVDVTNFNGMQWLESRGDPAPTSSNALHVIERWTRPDAQTIEYQAVIEDPKMLTGRYTAPKLRRGLLRFDMVQESLCLEAFAGTNFRETDAELEKRGLKSR